jgi:hypothetical protein
VVPGSAGKSIVRVEEQAPGHFRWPEIDVDLMQEMIEHPERFPLMAEVDKRGAG